MAGLISQNLMTTQRTCGKCGAPVGPLVLDNLCLNCLLDTAVESEAEIELHDTARDTANHRPGTLTENSALRTPHSALPTLGRFGDYDLLEEIGRGGMGVVYKARQASLNRIVALKMLPFGPLASPEFVKRFSAEAAAAASLQHPNIIAIHEVGVHNGQHYFAMDYVEGQTLAKLIAEKPLASRGAANYIRLVAEAIHYAHQRGILHRDLKPSNVLIDAFDQPRVTDFGLAKRLDASVDLTLTGRLLGSPNYMPPEQIGGSSRQAE